jgi:hypothetical protein
VDTKPTDPIEGMLIAQLVVANEAALDLYRRARPNRHFEAHTKYLQLADKASRTVANHGQACDRECRSAVVADQIVSSRAKQSIAALLTSDTEKPMEILEPAHKEAVLVTEGQR